MKGEINERRTVTFVREMNFITAKQAKLTKFTSRENNLLHNGYPGYQRLWYPGYIMALHIYVYSISNLDSQSKCWLQIVKNVGAKVYDFIFSLNWRKRNFSSFSMILPSC